MRGSGSALGPTTFGVFHAFSDGAGRAAPLAAAGDAMSATASELFTEAPSRVVACTTRRAELISRAAGAGVGFRVLGETGGDRVVVEGLVDLSLVQATGSWRGRLPSLLDGLAPASN